MGRTTKAQLEEQIVALQQEMAEMEFKHNEEKEAWKKDMSKLKKQLSEKKRDLKDKDNAVQLDLENQKAAFMAIMEENDMKHELQLSARQDEFKAELEKVEAKAKKQLEDKNAKIRKLQGLIQRLEKPQTVASTILEKRGLQWDQLAKVVDVIKTVREESKKA